MPKLLVLDFDQTIVWPHTFKLLGALEQAKRQENEDPYAILSTAEQKEYISTGLTSGKIKINNPGLLKALIEKTIAQGDYVAICSFSKYPGAIAAVLEHLELSKEIIDQIIIKCSLPQTDAEFAQGKNPHIMAAKAEIESRSKKALEKTVLIDDDSTNIIKSNDIGCVGIHVALNEAKMPEDDSYLVKAAEEMEARPKPIVFSDRDKQDLLMPTAITYLNLLFRPDTRWLIKDGTSICMQVGYPTKEHLIIEFIIIQNALQEAGASPEAVSLYQSSRAGVGWIISLTDAGVAALNRDAAQDYIHNAQRKLAIMRTAISSLKSNYSTTEEWLYKADFSISLAKIGTKDIMESICKDIRKLLPDDKKDYVQARESARGGWTVNIQYSALEGLEQKLSARFKLKDL